MCQQHRRVVVDPVGAGALQLLGAVAARQHADPERAGAPRREQVPDAVADDVDLAGLDPEPVDRRQEQVRVGLGVGAPCRG